MSEAASELALKIMALVDEHPSEPFSIERKWLEGNIKEMIVRHSGELDDELDTSFQTGYDEGYQEGQSETEQGFQDRISELEEELENLRNDLADMNAKIDQSFAEGYETASRGERVIETLDFK